MKILLSCLNFNSLTGSELYFYDLACGLKKIGCDVSILSNLKDGMLYQKAEKQGISCYDFTIAPNSKSVFDVIIASHRPIIELFIEKNLYPNIPIISVNHSEIIPLEYPVIDKRVIHYIAIRESIKKYLEDNYFILSEDISLIMNPINTDKLLSVKKNKNIKRKRVVFPATIDYLRKNTIKNLSEKRLVEDFDLVLIGKINGDNYIDEIKNKNVFIAEQTWNIQKYYANATHTSGIQLGRTEIEGYFFNLPCYRYTVDKNGTILSFSEVQPPSLEYCFDTFGYISVAKKIKLLCEKLINLKNN